MISPTSTEHPAYVNVSLDQAEELIASGQAEPADEKDATHELVPGKEEENGIERDEANWALDEATLEIEEVEPFPPYENKTLETVEATIQNIHPTKGGAPSSKHAPYKLPFPVILPQRRPGTKARGFFRTYAPVLQESGIDQEMFLSFLKNFHKAAQASPIFDVIIIASGIAGAYPDPLVGLGVMAVQVAAGIGQEIQERYRLNKCLSQSNRDVFILKVSMH